MDEVHKKTALWLTKTFDIIVLPKFNSTQMSHRQKRKINSKTVRKMKSWAHARFRNRLLSKAEEFGKIVITSVSEAYRRNLGGNKVFGCDGCGLQINRDLNGARGIFLRALLGGALVM